MVENKHSNLLPVPVDVIPAEIRLAGILPNLQSIISGAEKHKGLRAQNVAIVREALLYAPEFAEKIRNNLLVVRPILVAEGFIPRVNNELALKEMVSEVLDDHSSKPQVVYGPALVSDITRQVFKILHPDAGKDMNNGFSATEKLENYIQASKISKYQDPEAAQELLLETMPKYYLTMVKDMQRQGLSLQEIIALNPKLVSELEQIMWVAAHKFPKEKTLGLFDNPQQAKWEGLRIRRARDQFARYIGYEIIHSTVEDIITLAKFKKLVPELAKSSDSLLEYMKETGKFVERVDEISRSHGNSPYSPEVRKIQQGLEKYINNFPSDVQHFIRVVAFSNSAPDFDQAIEELWKDVESVRKSSEDSIEDLTYEIRKGFFK